MRVSDRSSARNYLKHLNQAKSAFAKTNEQIASGNRFERLSEDVSSGTRVMRTRMDLYKTEKHLNNVQSINEELATTESTMMSIEDILSDVHSTLLVKAMSEEKGDTGREAIANELKSLRQELLQFANAKYGKRYLFGGSNASLSAPFSTGEDGRLQYNGIPVSSIQKDQDGYFYLDGAGERQTIPMDEDVYMDIGLGIRMKESRLDSDTGYLISYSGLDILGFGVNEQGQPNNVYDLLTDIENTLRDYDKEKLSKLDGHLVTVTDAFRANLTDIGAKTKFLDTMQTRLKNNVDSYKTRINQLMGTNDAEAATTQTMNEYVLKAVLQMGARILPVSLMDFLK